MQDNFYDVLTEQQIEDIKKNFDKYDVEKIGKIKVWQAIKIFKK